MSIIHKCNLFGELCFWNRVKVLMLQDHFSNWSFVEFPLSSISSVSKRFCCSADRTNLFINHQYVVIMWCHCDLLNMWCHFHFFFVNYSFFPSLLFSSLCFHIHFLCGLKEIIGLWTVPLLSFNTCAYEVWF